MSPVVQEVFNIFYSYFYFLKMKWENLKHSSNIKQFNIGFCHCFSFQNILWFLYFVSKFEVHIKWSRIILDYNKFVFHPIPFTIQRNNKIKLVFGLWNYKPNQCTNILIVKRVFSINLVIQTRQSLTIHKLLRKTSTRS